MAWHVFTIACIGMGLLGVLLSYAIVYFLNREQHIIFWMIGWGSACIYAALLACVWLFPDAIGRFESAVHALTLVAAWLVWQGSARFRAVRVASYLNWITAMVVIWAVVTGLTGILPRFALAPVWLMTALLAFMAGSILWRREMPYQIVPCNIAAASLVLWGICLTGYPMVFWLFSGTPSGYHLIGLLCILLCSVALLGAYLGHAKCKQDSLIEGYQALLRHAPFPAIITVGEIVLYANSASMEMLHVLEPGQVIGKSMLDFIPFEQRDRARASIAEFNQTPIIQDVGEINDLDGREHTVRVTSLAIQHEGKPARLVLFYDLTGQEQLVEQARQAKAFSESLLQEASVMIIGLNSQGRIVIFNRAAEQVTGYHSAELAGSDWFETLVPRSRFPSVWHHFKFLRDTAEDGHSIWENPILTKAGQERIILWQNTNLQGIHPVIRTLSFGIDITELRQAQKHSEQAQSDLAVIFGEAHNAIIVLKNNVIEMANPAACRAFGYRQYEIEGKSTRILHMSDESHLECNSVINDELAQEGSWRGELLLRHSSGRGLWMDITLSNLPGGRVLGIMTDVTARRESDKQLQRLAIAVESSFEGKVITDTEGIIQYVNPAFENIFKLSRINVIGQPIQQVIHPVNPNDHVYDELWSTLRTGCPWSGQFTNRGPDGTEFIVESSIAPVRDSSGNVVAYIGSERDVTDKIRMQQQYRQSTKMEAIGTLAGGIAHDFNNILFAIQGYSEMAQEDLDQNSRAYRNLEEVLHASRRASRLVKQILTFSRQQDQTISPVDVGEITKEAVKFMRASLPAEVEITATVGQGIPAVLADSTQLYQVLINLCTNAGQAMQSHGGQLEIVVTEVDLDSEQAARIHASKPGKYIMLKVSDTGIGISPGIRDRIFEPFFTTKEVGEGTGLGLSVVHGIVTGAGGMITVESEEGKGTVFQVYLPSAESPEEALAQQDEELFRGHGRILIVEDERRIAFMMKQQLERLGYEVTTLHKAERALWVLTQTAIRFDLIISDYSMPGMHGLEMLRQASAAGVASRALLVSGNVHELEPDERERLRIHDILLKPLSMQELAKAVKAALSQE